MQIKVFRKRSFLNFSWLLLGRIYSGHWDIIECADGTLLGARTKWRV